MTTKRSARPLPALDAILWTPEDVAAVLVIPVTEVQRATDSGDLASIRFGSRRRYRPEDVRAWVTLLANRHAARRIAEAVASVEGYRTPQAGTRAG